MIELTIWIIRNWLAQSRASSLGQRWLLLCSPVEQATIRIDFDRKQWTDNGMIELTI